MDICPICGWQHDPVQESNPEDAGGPNRTGLRTAQRNFNRIGAYDEKALRFSRKPQSDGKKDL